MRGGATGGRRRLKSDRMRGSDGVRPLIRPSATFSLKGAASKTCRCGSRMVFPPRGGRQTPKASDEGDAKRGAVGIRRPVRPAREPDGRLAGRPPHPALRATFPREGGRPFITLIPSVFDAAPQGEKGRRRRPVRLPRADMPSALRRPSPAAARLPSPGGRGDVSPRAGWARLPFFDPGDLGKNPPPSREGPHQARQDFRIPEKTSKPHIARPGSVNRSGAAAARRGSDRARRASRPTRPGRRPAGGPGGRPPSPGRIRRRRSGWARPRAVWW